MPTDALCRAIATRRVLRFEYDGGLRTVEPHAHGFAADGAELLSGYQTFGVSASGDLPGWRTFRLDQIATLRVTDDPFTPRPDFDGARPGFSQLHCAV
jgi:predicted DNA-binding transcriptional regulator YafY